MSHTSTLEYLRSPGNQVPEGDPTLADRFRDLANQLGRAWAVSRGSETLTDLRPKIQFYEQVRVCMAKYDAEQRKAEGRPLPADIKRALDKLFATLPRPARSSTSTPPRGCPNRP
ncbi:type I restriction enzyme endonuclease domain-containing protein [Nocardia fluminea]